MRRDILVDLLSQGGESNDADTDGGTAPQDDNTQLKAVSEGAQVTFQEPLASECVPLSAVVESVVAFTSDKNNKHRRNHNKSETNLSAEISPQVAACVYVSFW